MVLVVQEVDGRKIEVDWAQVDRRYSESTRELVQLLEALDLDLVDDEGAGGHAPDVAHAAQHDHGENGETDGETEMGRRDNRQLGAQIYACQSGSRCPDGERQQLGCYRVDPHAGRCQLVFANSRPGAAAPGILQPV